MQLPDLLDFFFHFTHVFRKSQNSLIAGVPRCFLTMITDYIKVWPALARCRLELWDQTLISIVWLEWVIMCHTLQIDTNKVLVRFLARLYNISHVHVLLDYTIRIPIRSQIIWLGFFFGSATKSQGVTCLLLKYFYTHLSNDHILTTLLVRKSAMSELLLVGFACRVTNMVSSEHVAYNM